MNKKTILTIILSIAIGVGYVGGYYDSKDRWYEEGLIEGLETGELCKYPDECTYENPQFKKIHIMNHDPFGLENQPCPFDMVLEVNKKWNAVTYNREINDTLCVIEIGFMK